MAKRYYLGEYAPHNLSDVRENTGDTEYVLSADYDPLAALLREALDEHEAKGVMGNDWVARARKALGDAPLPQEALGDGAPVPYDIPYRSNR
jgi:hypothetical protein